MPNHICKLCEEEEGRSYPISKTRKVKRVIVCDHCLALISQIKKQRKKAGGTAAKKRKAK